MAEKWRCVWSVGSRGGKKRWKTPHSRRFARQDARTEFREASGVRRIPPLWHRLVADVETRVHHTPMIPRGEPSWFFACGTNPVRGAMFIERRAQTSNSFCFSAARRGPAFL